MNVFKLLTLEFNRFDRSDRSPFLNYKNRNKRENVKMKLSLPLLFLLSKAQETPEAPEPKPPVCGEYEELAECSNRCFESNCKDLSEHICPLCESSKSF